MNKSTQTNKSKPCNIADNLLLAPATILALLRTITAVTGKPPNKADAEFPIPCAINSLLVGVIRLKGSNLSEASMLNKVSKLATIAILNAINITPNSAIREKLGELKFLLLIKFGICTK